MPKHEGQYVSKRLIHEPRCFLPFGIRTMSFHLTCLRNEVGAELAVANPKDGVKSEHFASTQGTLQLLNEMVVPGDGLVLSIRSTPRGLGGVHAATHDHHSNGFEGVRDDGALWRSDDVAVAAEDQDDDADAEDAEAE